MAKRGRPSKYNIGLINEICKRIAKGESVLKICKDDHMPTRWLITSWLLDDDKKDFLAKYEKAVNIRTDNMFDDLLDIADDKNDVQRDRLKIDVRKWYLSKVMPKKYGEKLDIDHTTKGNPMPILQLLQSKEDVNKEE